MQITALVNNSIPLAMMGLYIAIVVILSYHVSFSSKARKKFKNQSFEEYYTAGKSMNGFIVGLVTVVTFYSGSTFTGKVGFTFNFGMIGLYSIVTCGATGIVMFFLSEKVWPLSKKYRLSTLSDLMELRYQNKLIKLVMSLTIVGFNIIFLVTEIRTLGMITNVASAGSISPTLGSLIAFLIIIAYVTTGGVRSVAAVDSFSAIIMLCGSLISVCYLCFYFFDGSISNIFTTVAAEMPNRMTMETSATYGNAYWISIVLMGTMVMLVYPSNYMGICLAKSVKQVKRSAIMTSLSGLWLIVYGILGYMALAVSVMNNGIDFRGAPEYALLYMASAVGNAFILGLVVTFILAATLGTLDSTLISMSGLISNDVITNLRAIVNKDACIGALGDNIKTLEERTTKNAKKEVRQTRILVVLLGIVGFYFSLQHFGFMVLLQNYATNGLCQIIPAAFGGMYWKKATPQGAIAAILSGVGLYLLAEYLQLSFGGFFIGLPVLAINTLIFIIVSLTTEKKFYASHKHLQGVFDDFFIKGKADKYIKDNYEKTD